MTSQLREVKNGIIPQGVNEEIYYWLDTTPWGNNPSSVSVTLRDTTTTPWTDVTVTHFTGATVVVGNIITLPKLSGLADCKMYVGEVVFTVDSGNKFSAIFKVLGEL